MRRLTIKLQAGVGGFAEDKDEAKRIRVNSILPALEENHGVTLDFSKVKYSTQSFVHALLGEVLQRFRDPALEKLEFKKCTPQVKSLIQLVVDYSLGGFRTEQSNGTSEPIKSSARQSKRPPRRGKP